MTWLLPLSSLGGERPFLVPYWNLQQPEEYQLSHHIQPNNFCQKKSIRDNLYVFTSFLINCCLNVTYLIIINLETIYGNMHMCADIRDLTNHQSTYSVDLRSILQKNFISCEK